MNQKNLDYLSEQIKYTGFGEALQTQLAENVKKQLPEFSLQHQQTFGKQQMLTALHFKKSPTSDMYFFNSYLASLIKDDQSAKLNQKFYIEKADNITLKEAFNLMNGRAVNKDLVNKEGQIYNAWVQLDFKNTDSQGNYKLRQYHQNYGFDLDKALAVLPIKELASEHDKARLVESLRKGNRQLVTFTENGSEQRRLIEANPQFKSITVYDEQSRRLRLDNTQQHQVKESKSQSIKVESDESTTSSAKPSKRKGLAVSQ
jgi:hypothetical protein